MKDAQLKPVAPAGQKPLLGSELDAETRACALVTPLTLQEASVPPDAWQTPLFSPVARVLSHHVHEAPAFMHAEHVDADRH